MVCVRTCVSLTRNHRPDEDDYRIDEDVDPKLHEKNQPKFFDLQNILGSGFDLG